MSTDRSMRDKAMAAYLRKMGITRTTGKCPRSCGAVIQNGGPNLIAHLNTCRGRPKLDARDAAQRNFNRA